MPMQHRNADGAVPENINTHPIECHWDFQGGGVSYAQNSLRKV